MGPVETMDEEIKTHHRRVRYRGTHPRKFSEKYKELHPEEYAADVQRVLQRGRTPAGTPRLPGTGCWNSLMRNRMTVR